MNCKHCKKPIYSAGGEHNKGQFGWLHTHSGSARCDVPVMPRAEPDQASEIQKQADLPRSTAERLARRR